MSISVTVPRYPLAPSGALRSIDWLPVVSWPQSARSIRDALIGWPFHFRFATPLPFALPPAPEGPVPADARAVTASAVISPLKSESAVTTASTCAAAILVTEVIAVAVDETAETTQPSAAYANAPSTARVPSGG